MISYPKLYYLGLLAGLLSRVPGMDFGTMLLALHIFPAIDDRKSKRFFYAIGILVIGYMSVQLLPLGRLELLFYRHSDILLSFFGGLILYFAFHAWDAKTAWKKILLALVVIAIGVCLKAWLYRMASDISLQKFFFSGLLTLIPAFDLKSSILATSNPILWLLFLVGFVLSMLVMKKSWPLLEYHHSWLKVSLLIVALCDYWPWRSFRHYLYMGDSARWVKDFPVLPELHIAELVFILFFMGLGMVFGWITSRSSIA